LTTRSLSEKVKVGIPTIVYILKLFHRILSKMNPYKSESELICSSKLLSIIIKSTMGARKQTGENLKVVGRVFNFKLDSFAVMKYVHDTHT
jgi:hypothetical protein